MARPTVNSVRWFLQVSKQYLFGLDNRFRRLHIVGKVQLYCLQIFVTDISPNSGSFGSSSIVLFMLLSWPVYSLDPEFI